MSEAASAVISVLLFATSSLVASDAVARETSVARSVVNTPSAFIALVDSVVKEVVSVASPAIRLVDSVARLVVNTFSALVALRSEEFSVGKDGSSGGSTYL